MRLFNFRKKQATDTVPPLAEQEYVAARKQRRGIALLIGVVTFTVASLLAMMLFFGGRWVYRSTGFKKVTKPIASQLKAAKSTTTPRNGQATSPDTPGTDQKNTTPPPASQPDPATTPNTSPRPATPPTGNNVPSPTQETPPVLSGQSADIPNTGPSGAIVLFVVTTLVSGSFYQLKMRLKKPA